MGQIEWRKAVFEDVELLFRWKNDAAVIQNSLSGRGVSREEHVQWLKKKLQDENFHLYLMEEDGVPIGQLRLDIEGNQAEISYSVAKEFRGKGYGKELLTFGDELAKTHKLERLMARVRPDNLPSRRLFEGLGYSFREKEGILFYEKEIGIWPSRPMIYIRADMNPQVATGHLMRCLSIADQIAQQGGRVEFITADEYPLELLQNRGYQATVLKTEWNDMEAELPQLIKLIEEKKVRKLLVDSYQVTANYLTALQKKTHVIYMDDLDRFEYPVSEVICYANYWKKLSYGSYKGKVRFHLGTAYVPLRGVFGICPPKCIQPKLKKILLLSGGTDHFHILEGLAGLFGKKKGVKVDIVCGAFYPNFNRLCEKYAGHESIFLHRNVDNLEELMKEADLAVSAGGTTLYELSAAGVPTISYSFADNQLLNVKQFDEEGIIPYAGDVRWDNIYEKIDRLYEGYHNDYALRKQQSIKMQKLVDGKGAWRIAAILLDIEG